VKLRRILRNKNMDFKTLGTVPLQPSEPMMPSGGEMPLDTQETPGMGADTPADAGMGMDQMPGLDQMPSAKPGIPGDGSGMATPEQLAELQSLLDAIEQKHQELGTEKIINKNEIDASTQDALAEVFQILKEAGVDLNDQNSINEFLQTLEAANPDMYDILVEILNDLMDPETPLDPSKGLDLSEVPTDQASALSAMQNPAPDVTVPPDLTAPPMDLSGVPQQ
jgi:hypothetical protein